MSHLSQFNTSIHNFIADIKKMNVLKSDVMKLESYVEITHINARALIRHFQQHILRDVLVSNILDNNIDFFLNYDVSKMIDEHVKDKNECNYAHLLVERIQELVGTMRKSNSYENINRTFDWIKMLCYHAYCDLGIDAREKFKELQRANMNAATNM
tara:strand:+ start:25905 stop:26372 length:468 start_codon:yes stop_codon:yes gene_type:complete